MRKVLAPLIFTTLILTGCSKAEDAADTGAASSSSADSKEGPGISPRAAPGVAFSYHYSFVLPDKTISSVQEQHAAACEKLGPSRCRITGLHYSLVDEDRVKADLQFKLDPELARSFGKEGIAAVEKAEGKLVDTSIDGDDVGSRIASSTKQSSELRAQLAETERKLAAGGLTNDLRNSLSEDATRLRQQLREESTSRSDGAAQLASTPMVFNYAGGNGFSIGHHPFADAASSGWTSMTTMISLVLLLLAVGLPWALLAGAFIFLWRTSPVRWLRAHVKGKSQPVSQEAQ